MDRANKLLDGEIDRREFLGAAGAALTSGLAGCGGSSGENNNPDGNNSNGSTSGGPTSGEDDKNEKNLNAEGNEPGNYPTQESSGLQAEADQLVADSQGIYAFKIEDYDFLDVEEFPNITDEDLHEESTLNELARSSEEVSFRKALYLAVNMQTVQGKESDTIYFAAESPGTGDAGISMYVNIEEQNGDLADQNIFVKGIEPDYSDLTRQEKKSRQEEFYKEHIDPDGIVHAVDLDEHDYAVEALHSGFGSE